MKSYFKDRKDYSITRLSMFLLSSPYALIYKRFSNVYIYHSVFPYYDVYDFSFITGKKKEAQTELLSSVGVIDYSSLSRYLKQLSCLTPFTVWEKSCEIIKIGGW